MFGGLELKSPPPVSSDAKPVEDMATAAPSPAPAHPKVESSDNIGSAFSFLMDGLSQAPPPVLPPAPVLETEEKETAPAVSVAPTPAPVPIATTATATSTPTALSGFSFLSSPATTSTLVSVPEPTTTIEEATNSTTTAPPQPSVGLSSSGFSFLSSSAPAPLSEPPPAAQAAPTESGFSFVSGITASAIAPPATTTTTTTESGFSFVSNAPDPVPVSLPTSSPVPTPTSSSSTPSVTLTAAAAPTPVATLSGVTFGGSIRRAAGPKPGIKKRRAVKKVGVAAQSAPPVLSEPLPPPVVEKTPPPPAPARAYEPEPPVSGMGSPNPLVEDADAARRKAEEFMAEKMRSPPSATFGSPGVVKQTHPVESTATTTTTAATFTSAAVVDEEVDEDDPVSILEAAMKAAAEANQGEIPPPQTMPKRPNFMGNLFRKGGLFRDKSDISESSGGGPAANVTAAAATSSVSSSSSSTSHWFVRSNSTPMTTTEPSIATTTTTADSGSRQFEPSAAPVEEPLSKSEVSNRDDPVEKEETKVASAANDGKVLLRDFSTSETKAEAPPPAPPSNSPEDLLERLLQNFRVDTIKAGKELSKIRSQRDMLARDRTDADRRSRALVCRMERISERLAEAVEAEDFEEADRLEKELSAKGGTHKELVDILQKMNAAVKELDFQHVRHQTEVMATCFSTLHHQLEEWKSERDAEDRQEGSDALQKFADVSKKISAETDRLQNELAHLERDEGIVEEERKQIEASISNQCLESEEARDATAAELESVNKEIEILRQQLSAKESAAIDLQLTLQGHMDAINRVRDKFGRQLGRVAKKEAAARENRREWDSEKSSLETWRESHENDMQAHSDALLQKERRIDAVRKETSLASRMESFWVTYAERTTTEHADGDVDVDDSNNEENGVGEVVRCEAAVEETQAQVALAQDVLTKLDDEVATIDAKLPLLETQKTEAAKRRDFKGAAKASRETKELVARRTLCMEERNGDAASTLAALERDLENHRNSLEAARERQDATNRKQAHATLVSLARTRNDLQVAIDGLLNGTDDEKAAKQMDNDEPSMVASVGVDVLRAEMEALERRAMDLDEQYGGWEQEKRKAAGESIDSKDNGEEMDNASDDNKDVDDSVKPIDVAVEARWRELMVDLNNVEKSLEKAVEEEDYDRAAELDERLETLRKDIENLGLTDAQMAAFEENDDNVGAERKGNEEELVTEENGDATPVEDAPEEVEETTTNKGDDVNDNDERPTTNVKSEVDENGEQLVSKEVAVECDGKTTEEDDGSPEEE